MKVFLTAAIAAPLLFCSPDAAAQAKKNRKSDKTQKATVEVKRVDAKKKSVADDPVNVEIKRNERPAVPVPAASPAALPPAAAAPYSYEFTRPGFTYPYILIEHDDDGVGTIKFQKSGFDETITDPLRLSPAALAVLKDSFVKLNFADSTDEYQAAKDFAHLGVHGITRRSGGKSRTVRFNWTDNKTARTLAEDYRRIATEYTWRFELAVARENQPLETPQLMATLDHYLERGDIVDPLAMVPLLTELANEERIPLIARNQAAKSLKRIEKKKK